MLLANTGEEEIRSQLQLIDSAATAIQDALARFPFHRSQEGKVTLSVATDFAFRGSRILFTYVIFNLLKNSFYAIDEAGGGEIVIFLSRVDDQNTIRFRDTGTGIAPDVLPNIFNEFFSSKRSGVGTGIGLSFCKRVIEGFGGTITCESRKGDFTEFILCLPTLDSQGGV
jgi:signal transduction histidine kinase